MAEQLSWSWGSYYGNRPLSVSRYLATLAGHAPLFEAVVGCKPKRVLEIGSGSGAMSTFLSYLGYEVTSLDNDRAVLETAERFCKGFAGKCRYLLGDAFRLRDLFGADSFDVVFSQGFFEHFPDGQIAKLLQEQLRVAPNVIFSVPSKHYGKRDFGNERLLHVEDWQKMLAGFKVRSIQGYHPKARGVKTILRSILLSPHSLFPWRQYEHLLIRIERSTS